MHPFLRPIVILGPTAGGKSDLAVALAEHLPRGQRGEILSADSMQVYRHLDAGTAKPSAELRALVPHHLIDIVEPTQRFTVADWLALAEPLIARLQSRGVRPIVVGGTNLYLKALLEGMFEGPSLDVALRAELAKVPAPELHARLAAVDPASAQRIHRNDHKKLVRALEVFHLTGKPMSQWQRQWHEWPAPGTAEGQGPKAEGREEAATAGHCSDLSLGLRPSAHGPRPTAFGPGPPALGARFTYRHDPILIGLDWPVEAINRRINARVKAMFFSADGSESLPKEVRRLEAAGLLGPQAREALGYKQVLEHLAGRCSLEEAFERTKVLTRRFAKTQRTWLRRFRDAKWIPADDRPLSEMLYNAILLLNSDI